MTNAFWQPRRGVSALTWVGLFISLFGILVVRQAVVFFAPSFTVAATICRESLHWLCAIALLLIIKGSERLPLSSVGIATSTVLRSLLWGLLLAIVCAAVGFAIAIPTHFGGGKTAESLGQLPLWLVVLVVIRAGVVEELFYRGYAIERLQLLGLSKYSAATIPLVVFALGHWRGGWPNVLIALALGAVLSASYLWRRDLVANMIGHFTVDFVGVILPRLIHHS